MIVIKEADKGLGVVGTERGSYPRDLTVYSKLDSHLSGQRHQIITDALDIIRDRGDINEKTLKYLMVNN